VTTPSTQDLLAFWDSTAVNLFPNPRFEGGALNSDFAQAFSGVTASVSVGAPALDGSYSLRLGWTANTNPNSGTSLTQIGWTFPVSVGDVRSVAADVGFTGVHRARMEAIFYKADLTTVLGTTTVDSTAAGTGPVPERIKIENLVAPLNAAYLRIRLEPNALSGTPTGMTVWDRIMLNAGSVALPFFDGDMGGCYWTGPRFWSTSARRGEALDMEAMKQWVPPYYYSVPDYAGV
jgi:hypothetical protein